MFKIDKKETRTTLSFELMSHLFLVLLFLNLNRHLFAWKSGSRIGIFGTILKFYGKRGGIFY